ncbi:M24 family metallopeptidase [Psychrosphaera ytuae]|uniref:M24 family metallopeptidase n=1 Tax=Psychrosphaera ytuae TaxID=2820710 RepID=A0A975DA01_9GAMM|nr:M24 family metallopeptidase [Psychrosphaera ytuae]QTH63287.1 M24 family metallopeptidase [Psychrosphaera ytuae]
MKLLKIVLFNNADSCASKAISSHLFGAFCILVATCGSAPLSASTIQQNSFKSKSPSTYQSLTDEHQRQDPYLKILPMRKRAAVVDELLRDKLDNTLPRLMRRTGIDLWVLTSREYNEDPVLRTMLPSSWINARRQTILVLYDNGTTVERYAIARYAVGDLFQKAWDKEANPDQWQALVALIKSKQPKRIGINQSTHFALADGITATEQALLFKALPDDLSDKVVSAEKLAIAWLETRTEKEMPHYRHLTQVGHKMIATAFSNKVVKPGVTTTDDVVWWLREESRRLKMTNWFHPTVSIQRSDKTDFDQLKAFSDRPKGQVIMPGDLLHVDFGLTYLRLNSDQQQHAYVLRPGETEVPDYLIKALANGNRVQDIFTAEFQLGRTGNQILSIARKKAINEGLKPTIYTHPIGYHGHAAGPTIGMWDNQGDTPVRGDYPLFSDTAYSIELNAATYVEEWGKEIRIMLEEEAFFDGKSVTYLDGRQTALHTIYSK